MLVSRINLTAEHLSTVISTSIVTKRRKLQNTCYKRNASKNSGEISG